MTPARSCTCWCNRLTGPLRTPQAPRGVSETATSPLTAVFTICVLWFWPVLLPYTLHCTLQNRRVLVLPDVVCGCLCGHNTAGRMQDQRRCSGVFFEGFLCVFVYIQTAPVLRGSQLLAVRCCNALFTQIPMGTMGLCTRIAHSYSVRTALFAQSMQCFVTIFGPSLVRSRSA